MQRVTDRLRLLLLEVERLETENELLKAENDRLRAQRIDPVAREPSKLAEDVGERILRAPELARRVGLARSTIWRMVKDGEFPEPVRMGMKSVGWRKSEVETWMAQRLSIRETPMPSPRKRGRPRKTI